MQKKESLNQTVKYPKLKILSIFDLSTENMFGMKRYISLLLKKYPLDKMEVVVVKQRGGNKLGYILSTILNEIFIIAFISVVERFKKNDVFYLVTSQHLSFSGLFLPRSRSIIVFFDLIALSDLNNIGNKYLRKLKFEIYHVVNKFRRVIVMSDFVKAELINKFGVDSNKIHIVKASIDQKKYYPMSIERIDIMRNKLGIGKGKSIILYVGDETPRKNLSTLVKALVEVKKSNSDITFLKIGKASRSGDRKNFLQEVIDAKLVNDTIIIDYVPDNLLYEYYNVADVFVFPSLSEGFGLPPLEAMACGVPVITTQMTSIPEVVGNSALLLNDPLDIKELGSLIEMVICNKNVRIALIKKGFQQVKKNNIESETFYFQDLITNIPNDIIK